MRDDFIISKFYLIKSREKKYFRILLRNLSELIKKSSLYILEDCLYLVIKTNLSIKNKMLGCEVFIKSDGNLDLSSQKPLSLLEKILFAWGESEIEQSIDFIRYETESNFRKDGRALIKYNKTIIRSFSYLADIFAIVNMTPDSFSDAGKYNHIEKALELIIQHINNGATIIDIGVESTRPGAMPLIDEEEINKLQLILKEVIALKQEYKFLISLDSYHVKTVSKFCEWDIDIINDVSGDLPLDLVKECTDNEKRYLAMHSLSIPANKDILININIDPVKYIYEWMQKKLNALQAFDIPLEQIILDPGIGFGNNQVQGWFIMNHLNQFQSLPVELLLGFSRKSLFMHITNAKVVERDFITAVMAAKIANKIDYLRLHDVRELSLVYSIINELRFN